MSGFTLKQAGSFPSLCIALNELFLDNGMLFTKAVHDFDVPDLLVEKFELADTAALLLRRELSSLIKTADIQSGQDPSEPALLVFASGDEETRVKIRAALPVTMSAQIEALDEILEEAFDGTLAKRWRDMYGRN